MGILTSLFGAERRTYNSADDFWYQPIISWTPTASGVRVDSQSAMRSSAVAACVRVLSESVASLPLHIYKRMPDGGKIRAMDHDLYDLLHNSPNELMSAYQWLEVVMVHLTLTGNHYSEIYYNKRGRVASLMPLDPNTVDPQWDAEAGTIRYVITLPDGKKRELPLEKVLHVPGLGWNGLRGMSPITYARETVGMALAGEEFGARFYGSGLNPGHIFTLPEGTRFDDEQTQKFLDDLKEKYGGLGKSHKSMVLPTGMTVETVGIPPQDAQYLEVRRFQVEEIARLYRCPLHMIGETSKSTTWGTGIESLSLEFVKYTLRPWLTRIQQVLDRRILPSIERQDYFIEFLIEDLLRGDQAARSQYYVSAIQNGWMSRNEVRIIENLNPVEGGDEFLVPLNMINPTLDGASRNEPVAGSPAEEPRAKYQHLQTSADTLCQHAHTAPVESRKMLPTRYSIQKSFVGVIEDAMARVLRRERNDVTAAAKSMLGKREAETFNEWLVEFYEKHAKFTSEQVRAAMTALHETVGTEALREIGEVWEDRPSLQAWLDAYIVNFGERYGRFQLEEILRLINRTIEEGGDVVNAVIGRYRAWEAIDQAARARTVAQHEVNQLGNGTARMAWTDAGVITLMWVTTGKETCRYCSQLEGRTISIKENFFEEGGSIEDMTFGHNVGHPPLHAGCDCILVPGS